MKKTADDTKHHKETIIAAISCLIAEADKLSIRRHVINRTTQRLNYILLEEDDMTEEDQLEQAIAHHETIAEEISNCVDNIEKEIARVRKGYNEACELKNTNAKRILLSYIADDVTLSLVNIRRTRREYQMMFIRLRELAAFWI